MAEFEAGAIQPPLTAGPPAPPKPRPKQQIASAFEQLIALEERVSDAAVADDDQNELRVYEWRPSGPPELPCIFNWLDDGTYEVVDTARGDDVLVVTATIGVQPSDIAENMGQLVTLTDIFRTVVDPALNENRPLAGTVRYAKRICTVPSIEDFNGTLVMCMNMLIRLELTAFIQ